MEDNRGIEGENGSIEKQIEQDRADELESNMSTKAVMATKTGRHFVWEQLNAFGVYRDGFTADPYVHAHNAGVKSAGLKILHNIISVCPDEYERMFSEHKYKEE